MDEEHLNIKIKQEKLTPERVEPKDDIEKLLDSNLFRENEQEDCKKEIEPTKTSDQLLEELFSAFGANVNIPDILNSTKEKKSKKKKRKHDDSDNEDNKTKHKKSKKSKKIKQEPDSGKEDSKEKINKIKKIKKEGEKEVKKEVTERRKLSIVIKDLKLKTVSSQVVKQSSSSSKDKAREKEKEIEKEKRRKSKEREKNRKSREKKSTGNVSDVSLSDEETYRKMLEYHTSSQWHEEQSHNNHVNHVRDWDREKYVRRGRSPDNDRHSSRYHRHRSRSRSRSRKHSPIDKKKLLEIARRNAISMLRSGTLPRNLSENTKEKLVAKIRHGGQSIEELTNYCKKLSKAEDLGDLSSFSDSDNDGDGKPRAFHHPFEVKDRGPIVMNIRNSVPIAPKQASELKAIMSQFPVSSGKQHQKVENTWIPVTTTNAPTTVTTVATISKPVVTLEKQIQEQLPELARPKPAPIVEPSKPLDPALSRPYDWKSDNHYLSKSIIAELAPPPQPPVDVSEIISQRLNAMRKLQENPCDNDASKVLFETQQNMSQWAQSKYTPGQFLGSTDVRVLSVKELAAGSQAWARKNQLIDSQPVTSGMGMHLLKKMGWCPGEGLGKEKNGSLQPLLLELKLDKRGLESNDEASRQKQQNQNRGGKKSGPRGGAGGGPVPLASLEQKHPVSLLGELASKRRWGAPNYTLVHEQGPAHAKSFVFKVRLNGIDYTCPTPANNKKEAKSCVAKFCLQQLGILPS